MDHPEHEETDISSIRAEIRALQTRKRFLASSLLCSDALQKHLQTHVPAARTRKRTAAAAGGGEGGGQITDPSPLLQTANVHAQTNQHRIAFSTTTFPFRDRDAGKLLGVRIDVCTRGGRFVNPYYVLLKRDGAEGEDQGDTKRLRVHRHTIPAFVPMKRLQRIYLPLSTTGDEDGDGDRNEEETLKPWKTKPRRNQNLASFVRVLRRSLTAWHLRQDAVVHLRERLGVPSDQDGGQDGNQGGKEDQDDKWTLPDNDLGLVSLGPTTLEARYIRLEWDDGRVGRFKVSDTGRVERAVVIGDRGRDKGLESVLTDGQGRVEDVIDRLLA